MSNRYLVVGFKVESTRKQMRGIVLNYFTENRNVYALILQDACPGHPAAFTTRWVDALMPIGWRTIGDITDDLPKG